MKIARETTKKSSFKKHSEAGRHTKKYKLKKINFEREAETMKNGRKLLAIILVICMAVSMLPIAALADGEVVITDEQGFLNEAKALINQNKLGEATATKVVEPTSTPGEYDISLYVAGKNGVPKVNAIDIVFVIDSSTSMRNGVDMEAAQAALVSAINDLYFGENTDTNVKDYSRVAVLTFDDDVTIAKFKTGNINWMTKPSAPLADIAAFNALITNPGGGETPSNNPILDGSGGLWTKHGATTTQYGIHAAHYLLNNLSRTGNYANNRKIMIVMTDGAPNGAYTGSNNTYSATMNGVHGMEGTDVANASGVTKNGVRYMLATQAPNIEAFRNNRGLIGEGAWASASADGNYSSVAPANAQAMYAYNSGIAIYTIGYRYDNLNATAKRIADNVMPYLIGTGGTGNFTKANETNVATILPDITAGAAIRLNDLTVTDKIGSSFEFKNAITKASIQQMSYTVDTTMADFQNNANWSATSESDTIAVNGKNVTWELGQVEDNTLYRVKFTIRIPEATLLAAADGTVYYTNMDSGEGTFSSDETLTNKDGDLRGKQSGDKNKLTYVFDNNDKDPVILHATEKYTVNKKADLTIAKAEMDGDHGPFNFTVTLNCAYTVPSELASTVTGVTEKGITTLTFTLNDGARVVIPGIPKGTQYTVEETNLNNTNYKTPTYTVGNATSETGYNTGPQTLTDGTTVTFTNYPRVRGVALEKTIIAKKAVYVAGEKVVFKVTVTNTGEEVITSFVFEDVMSGGRDPGKAYSDQDCTTESAWPDGIAGGASITRYYYYDVTTSDEGNITNQASVTNVIYTNDDGGDENLEKEVDFDVAKPELTIVKKVYDSVTKTWVDSAYVGNGLVEDEALFMVEVKNSGTVTAKNVLIEEDENATLVIKPDSAEIPDPTGRAFDVPAGVTYTFYFTKVTPKNHYEALELSEADQDLVDAYDAAKAAYDDAAGVYNTAVGNLVAAEAAFDADTTTAEAIAVAAAQAAYAANGGDAAIGTLKKAYDAAEAAYGAQLIVIENIADEFSAAYDEEVAELAVLAADFTAAKDAYNEHIDLYNAVADAQNAFNAAKKAAVQTVAAAMDTAKTALEKAGTDLQAASDALAGLTSITEEELTALKAKLAEIGEKEVPNTAKIKTTDSDTAIEFVKTEDSAKALVKPVKDSAIIANKKVSVDGGATYHKFIVLTNEELATIDTVTYQLTVINVGFNTEKVQISDMFDGTAEDLSGLAGVTDGCITLEPGDKWVGTYTKGADLYLNNSYTSAKEIGNVLSAKIVATNDEPVNGKEPIDSETLVITTPKKYVKLAIDKTVLTGMSQGVAVWAKSHTIIATDAQNFTFKIEVTNNGTDTAKFDLSDNLTTDIFTDIGCETPATVTGVTLTPGATATFYAKINVASNTKVTNTATYTITEGEVKPGDDTTGDSSADASVIPQPQPRLSVEKSVEADVNYLIPNFRIEDGKGIIKNGAGDYDVWFVITVTNKGLADGSVILKDIFEDAEQKVYRTADATTAEVVTSEPITVSAGAKETFFVLVHFTSDGNSEHVNLAQIFDPGFEDGDDPIDEDKAKVIVTEKTVVPLNIKKYVRIKGDEEWQDVETAILTGANEIDVEYKIVVSVDKEDLADLNNFDVSGKVKDVLGEDDRTADVTNGTETLADWNFKLFFYAGEGEQLSDEFIYEVKLNSASARTYTNVASFVAPDGDNQKWKDAPYIVIMEGEDDAKVTITKPGIYIPSDVTYTIVHEYYVIDANGNRTLEGTTTETKTVRPGTQVDPTGITRVPGYNGNTYGFESIDPNTVQTINGNGTKFTLVYTRTTTSDIDIGNPDTPLADLPKDPVDIDEDDVPLASIPKTGDKSVAGFAAIALLCGAGLTSLLSLLKKKEQD